MSLEARLTRYYKKYNPDQLEKIPYLAKKYQNNDDVLFEALQKKYGPEPKVEDIERMHELAHASNHDIAKRFLGIMAVLSNTINSDSCGLKQQGRVVGEVAMAMAKIKKTNEILREIFTTCRESQLQEKWGGLTRSCTIASYFCEFVTFDEEEAKLSQEAKEEDDEDDEIPKEKAMNGMLRVRGVRLISRQNTYKHNNLFIVDFVYYQCILEYYEFVFYSPRSFKPFNIVKPSNTPTLEHRYCWN